MLDVLIYSVVLEDMVSKVKRQPYFLDVSS